MLGDRGIACGNGAKAKQRLLDARCQVRRALRKTLFKYKRHKNAAHFEKAYGCIREHY